MLQASRERGRRAGMRSPAIWLAVLLLGGVATTGASAARDLPAPRIAATYTSWPQGGYQFREKFDPLFAQFGWPFTRVENLGVAEVIADLDRTDIFFPLDLYNYDHPQPFEQYKDAWLRFLNRGGVIVGLDANYGQQIGWLTTLGEGLALRQGKCQIGCDKGAELKLTVTAPDDPCAPTADVAVPWGHFESYGPNWKVLAKCPDGHAVALRTEIGKGVLIATTMHSDRGYPNAECARRIWQAQWAKLGDPAVAVRVDRGLQAVGGNQLTVTATGLAEGKLLCETKRAGGKWEAQEAALQADENGQLAATLPYRAAGGRTDVRLVVSRGGQAKWWTSFTVDRPDVPAIAGQLHAKLDACPPDLGKVASALQARRGALVGQVATVEGEASTLLAAEATAAGAKRWAALAAQLGELDDQATVLVGRAEVAVRASAEPGGGRAFAVVRSEPLAKLHRDASPAGPTGGPLRIEAARGEGESLQVGIVPTGADLDSVQVRLGPLTGPNGSVIGAKDVELYRVSYLHVKGPSRDAPASPSWWPDPLLPADKPFAVKRVCQPLWVDVFVPREARAGLYKGDLVIAARGQSERVPVELRVRDFALPATQSLRQAFVLRAFLVSQKYLGGTADDYVTKLPVEKLLKMGDVCLKRRVGLQYFGNEGAAGLDTVMPYMHQRKTAHGWEFDFTDADRIWSHLHNTGMRTLGCGNLPGSGVRALASGKGEYAEFMEAYFKALQPHLDQKGWLDEAVFYMADEPWQEESIVANVKMADLMDRVCPRIKRLFTAPRDPRLMGRAQIWVPGGMPEAHPEDKEGQVRAQAWLDRGAEMWWYICCGPTHPYPNFFVDYPTIDSRMVFWLTWKYKKTGFLYWGVEYYGDPKELTPDGLTEKYAFGTPEMGNGDGVLTYYGPDMTLYPSLRLNAIRDGLEDYEYFTLLKQRADAATAKGKAPALVARARKLLAVDERVLRTTNGSPSFAYTLEARDLQAVRHEMAEVIEGLGR